MASETNPKPCPFCGQEDDGITLSCITHPAGSAMAAIECHVCGMIGPIVYKDGHMDQWSVDEVTERKAWEAWEEREVKNEEQKP